MNIDEIANRLLAELLKNENLIECFEKLEKMPGIYEKVNFIEKLLRRVCRGIPGIHFENVRRDKNNDDSEKYRKEGNEYFSLKKKNYLKAVELYNKSICFAPKGSENLGIGYANRSAIFLEWKNYKECLASIELARSSNYPDKLLPKLQKREEHCLQAMSKSEENDDNLYNVEFDLSHENHPQVPFISNCLDIKKDAIRGRYVYTKEELVPGQLVSINEPFCSILRPQQKYLRCANCIIENNFNLIPCPNCTCAMFCSEKCMEEASKGFHKYECPVIDVLFQLFDSVPLLALRVTLFGLQCFDDVEKLMNFCKAPENEDQDVFSIDYKNFNETEHYRAIYGLVTHEDKVKSSKFMCHRATICAMLRHFMLKYTSLKEVFKTEDTKKCFTNLLFKHLQAVIVNAYTVDFRDVLDTRDEDLKFAAAMFAFDSLFNHSCAPNILRVYKNTKCYTFVLRPIPKNGVLYENYKYTFLDQSRQGRQEMLERQYDFRCECEACVNDYPRFKELGFAPEFSHFEMSNLNYIDMLLSTNKKFAKENYKRYISILHRYAKHYPCRQIVLAEACWQMAIYILLDAIPLEWKIPFI